MGKDEGVDYLGTEVQVLNLVRFIDRRHPDTFAFVVFTNIRNT